MLKIIINHKKYKDRTILENINISIDCPGIYGVIGKNGQGKTTLFKCMLSLESFNGNCFINEEKVVLKNAGWVPTEPPIYGELTAEEFYDFYAHLLDVKIKNNNRIFEVPNNQLIREFSTGMKKKTYLNAVFQKEFPIYILDEPFNGLDLESNYLLMNHIRTLSQKSIVLISSHILEILYKDCDKIFLLKNKSIFKFEKEKYSKIEKELFLL
ncbi:ATP-binding cassette domain-containing protein [Flavobacterium sp. HBTb2-11-1]|uniref:ATP-binding cassette domain-containing protein n=1 Tax=Flavobacterium sp. HBTb2-11-1 TaxID=2692212 RepID=UPI00136E3BC9|nr:ATP-binding cassette domain-containing protein [Flavobacterium sp. HBTb2-11-1]MXO03334.1 ATP-binding cassette domain-containing protein [Flavobacterium sp. HBTb2-11-1]